MQQCHMPFGFNAGFEKLLQSVVRSSCKSLQRKRLLHSETRCRCAPNEKAAKQDPRFLREFRARR